MARMGFWCRQAMSGRSGRLSPVCLRIQPWPGASVGEPAPPWRPVSPSRASPSSIQHSTGRWWPARDRVPHADRPWQSPGRGMGTDLTGILACPHCQAGLPDPSRWPGDGQECPGCKARLFVVRGVPRFVDSDAYAKSFSFEWKRHPCTQLDSAASRESEETFRAKTGLRPEDVAGRLVLDVGCGMGRFADVVSRWGGQVVGVDLSLAIEAAHANLGGRANVRLLQADLFRLPFQPGTFDIVYSIGVLHHTPDCEKAFRQLVPFVRLGGRLCVWVYGTMGPWERFARLYRRVTVRMPRRLLHTPSHAALPSHP